VWEREHLEDATVEGRKILKWMLKKWDGGGMDWIDLASDRNWWPMRVNTVMNIRVP